MKKLLLFCLLLPSVCLSQQKIIDSNIRKNVGQLATNRLAGGAYSNSAAWTDVRTFRILDVQINARATTSGTSNVVLTAYKSLDHVRLDPAPILSFTLTLTGTNYATLVTNLNVDGFGWVNWQSITNELGTNGYLTNLEVWTNPKN